MRTHVPRVCGVKSEKCARDAERAHTILSGECEGECVSDSVYRVEVCVWTPRQGDTPPPRDSDHERYGLWQMHRQSLNFSPHKVPCHIHVTRETLLTHMHTRAAQHTAHAVLSKPGAAHIVTPPFLSPAAPPPTSPHPPTQHPTSHTDTRGHAGSAEAQ